MAQSNGNTAIADIKHKILHIFIAAHSAQVNLPIWITSVM